MQWKFILCRTSIYLLFLFFCVSFYFEIIVDSQVVKYILYEDLKYPSLSLFQWYHLHIYSLKSKPGNWHCVYQYTQQSIILSFLLLSMDVPQFVYHSPPTEGHLGCLQFGDIMNKADMDIHVHAFCINISFHFLG